MNIKSRVIAFTKKYKIFRFMWHKYHDVKYFVTHPFPSYNKRNREGLVIQMVSTLSEKDAIGNCVLEISKELDKLGIKNYIVYEGTHTKISNGIPVNCFKFNDKDTVIYHMGIGCNMSNHYTNIKVKKKIMYYHNITPSIFFFDNPVNKHISELGREQLIKMKDCTDLALCDSRYNEGELLQIGYKKTIVSGIHTRIKDLLNQKITTINDNTIRLLTVGRVVRNKCIQDVIKVFNEYYQINKNSKLYIVGKCDNSKYEQELLKLIEELNLGKHIVFDYEASENKLANYYANSDAYICMSEHEGFCIPLYEARAFTLPIFAYNCCAIGENANNFYHLFNNKNFKEIATSIDKNNKKKREYKKEPLFNTFQLDLLSIIK